MVENILQWNRAIVTTTSARWFTLVQTFPLELLTMRPAPDEWSALECLQHLVDVEQTAFPVRLKALMAGQPFPAFDPNRRSEKPPLTVELAAEFDRLRKETLKLLDQVTDADLGKEALHAEYGVVTMSQFLHHMAAHDLNHTVQAERAMMQPFMAGCGPWIVNYDDHQVKVTK